MPKGKPLIVFTLVFALVVLFAAGEVMAQQEECYDPTGSTCTIDLVKKGLWTVSVVSAGNEVTVLPNGTPVTGKACDYDVQICKEGIEPCTSQGLGEINFFLPNDCCPNEIEVLYGSPSLTPATGNTPVDDFHVHQAVWDWTAQNPTGQTWRSVTSSCQYRKNSFCLSVGGVWGCCELYAPYCPPLNLDAGRNFTQCINFGEDTPDDLRDDTSLYVVRSSTLRGCAARAWSCNAHRCPGCSDEFCDDNPTPPLPEGIVCEEISPGTLPDNVVFLGNINPVCQDEKIDVIWRPGSKYYYYYYVSGGTPYEYCYRIDPQPTVRVALSYCR